MKSYVGIENCIRGDSAPCTCACPFELETRDFIEKLRRGSFDAAFKIYRNAVVFPDIVARICPQPCRSRCALRSAAPIELRALELATLRYTRSKKPTDFNMPPKTQRVAIVGAGLSGLACALRLASKRYQVTVYEKAARLGGSVYDYLPAEVALDDIERQLQFLDYTLKLNTEITALDEIEADAIYIATGANGPDFGLAAGVDADTTETTRPGVFLGGERLSATDPVLGIADGTHAARFIERWLMVGIMLRDANEPKDPPPQTRLRDEFFGVSDAPATRAADGEVYTKDETKAEALRCLKCNCDACVSRCDFMEFFRAEPKVVRERVEGTLMGSGGAIIAGNSKRLIASCSQCGACGEKCPEGIDIGAFILESRRKLHQDGSLPPAWNDFWQRDMAFSNGESAALFRTAPGHDSARFAFFPGCQLGASDPRYVGETYRWLLRHEPDTALMLACCGAPADWGGRGAAHTAWIERLRGEWERLGKPTLLFACPTCKRMLGAHLPEASGTSVYEHMAPWGLPDGAAATDEPVAVFDPCASRRESAMQQGVRTLLTQAGAVLTELPASGAEARCCGWGGNTTLASPKYVEEIVQKRIAQSDVPYIAYCTNCRDSFAQAGKPGMHVLDWLFGLNDMSRPSPGASERRENRRTLKAALRREIWKEDLPMEKAVRLTIDPALMARLDKELILADDLREVIERCEASGRKLVDQRDGHFIGHLSIGPVTYWAEYERAEDGWRVLNAYSHRLVLQERDRLSGQASV